MFKETKRIVRDISSASEQPMIYNSDILNYILKLGVHVSDAFTAMGIQYSGISNMSIYGSIIEEWNDRHENPIIKILQETADIGAINYAFGHTHEEIVQSYKSVTATYADNPDAELSKLEYPILLDVGSGNIQIYTAIRLLNSYIVEQGLDDPLAIKHYHNNYDQLITDLVNSDNPVVTAKFATLMIKDAVSWFETHATNWNDLSQSHKEALTVFFYNVGREEMQSRYDATTSNYTVNVSGTLIATEYLMNLGEMKIFVHASDGIYVPPSMPSFLHVKNAIITEGGTLEFVVIIDGGEPVDHDITFTGTTYQGTTSNFVNGLSPDYDGVNRTYTIQAGQTQVVVYVPTDRDEKYEKNETVELRISNSIGAKISDGIAIGTITDDDEKSLTLTLENFEIDINRFLEDGDDPRVSYIISHDNDEDLSNVKLSWHATKNGKVDDDAIFLGYESAGKLLVGERDREGQDLEPLMNLSGDWKIVTTAEYRGLDNPIVLRVDEVSLSQPLPEMQSVTLDNEQWVNEDNDLLIDYVLHNPTDDDMRGFEIKFYASKSNKFDTDTAIYLDRESGGTLRVGEEDNEGETIQAAADLDAGDWNLYSVAYWDGHEDGVVLSTDEFTVAGNSLSVDLSIDNFRLDDNTLEQDQDLVVRQTSINYGSEDARGTETTYYWSADKHLNVNEDTILDKDGHGTLRAGEHDTNEYERIDYEDLPKGLGYVFAYIDADQEFDEGLMNELNNHSDWQALYVA